MKNAKIYIQSLHKSFPVRHSNKNMRESYKFQLAMAKVGQITDVNDPDEQFNLASSYSDKLVDFPVSVLKLNDKQAEQLDDMEQDELQKLDVRLALTVQGLSEHEINETIKDMEDATKSNNNKSGQKG